MSGRGATEEMNDCIICIKVKQTHSSPRQHEAERERERVRERKEPLGFAQI